MQIPQYIDLEAWNGFVDMRKATKRPMTERAMSLLITRLDEMEKKGHDVNACLDQSTLRNWQTVYPMKEETVPNLVKTEFQREPERTPLQLAADIAARDAFMAKLSHLKIVRAA